MLYYILYCYCIATCAEKERISNEPRIDTSDKISTTEELPLPSLYVLAQCVVQLHHAIICRRDIVAIRQTVDCCLQILFFQFGDLQCGLNFLQSSLFHQDSWYLTQRAPTNK